MSDANEFALELFSGMGAVRVRKMFGGAGLFLNDVMFALLDDETIYLKTDAPLQAALEAEGAVAWVYEKDPNAKRTYWRLPEAALDDPEEAARWGMKAYAVAAALKKPKKAAAKRKRA